MGDDRLELGIGASRYRREYEPYGYDLTSHIMRVNQLDEALTIVNIKVLIHQTVPTNNNNVYTILIVLNCHYYYVFLYLSTSSSTSCKYLFIASSSSVLSF